MRNISLTVLALCAMATTSAMAAENIPAPGDCATMAVQVRTALDANQSSSNYADAKKESNYGRDFCNNSLPKAGVAHYAAALKLLGVSPT